MITANKFVSVYMACDLIRCESILSAWQHILRSVICPHSLLAVLSADCSGGSDLTMSPEERVPMRRSSTREQDRRSAGTCFLLAASDYTCPADGGIRKTGN